MSGRVPQSITSAFSARLARTWFVLVGLAAVVAGLVTARVVDGASLRSTVDDAHVVAAALEPGRGGDLSVPFKRLHSRCDRLVAVGALDTEGRLHTAYPDREAHRQALNMALAPILAEQHSFPDTTKAVELVLNDPASGERIDVTAVVLPHNGSASRSARRILIILRRGVGSIGTWGVAGAFAVPMAGIGLLGFISLRSWFERSIAQPLRRMAHTVSDPFNAPIQTATRASGRWRETAQIAEQFESLMRSLVESDAKRRRTERESERRLRDRVSGFNRELRRARDRATTDALTKLKNRAFLDEQLEPMLAAALAKNSDLAAIMIDVDNFKQYNDTHGHLVGDALLAFIGTLLRGTIRPVDHAIRYAGDEFLLLLPDVDADGAALVADRTVKLFRQYSSRLGDKATVSLSAGVASVLTHGCADGKALVAAADSALYSAKRGGKNAVAAYRTA